MELLRLQERHISRNLEASVPDKTDIDGKRVKLTWLKSAFQVDGNSTPVEMIWHNKKEKRALEHKVTIEVRMLIDKWCESQFIWRPYLDEELFVLIPERAYDDVDNWCSIMPLIHFALVEMFYGNRVLRQFGYHQPVPEMPLNMDEYEMIDTRGKSDSNWPVKHGEYIEKWNARATTRPRCDPLTTDDFDLSSSSYHYWLLQNSRPKLTTQADRDAWFLLFPSSGLRRGTSGSGSSSSAAAGGSRGARGRGAGRGAAKPEPEPEPEYAHQVEEGDVQFDTGSYAVTHGEPSWETAIQYSSVGDDTSGQLWRGQQPWSDVGGNFGNCYVPQFIVSQPQSFDTQPVGVDYMSSVMATTSLSSPLVSTGVGGAGPSIFTTPRRMNVESEEDNDDEDSGDDGDGDRRGEGRVRNAPRRYDDTGSLHRQTLTRRRRGSRN
ncbi:hypothetical protein GQ457_02G033440 [Hibiscus cannabinus]